MMIPDIVMLVIVVVIGVLLLCLMFDIGKTLLKIAAHFIAGWILLSVVNFVLGIHIPINIITLAISGFGGVVGTLLLTIFYLIF